MLVIKKRFIDTRPFMLIAVGIAAFCLSLGTLFVVHPQFGSEQSAFVKSDNSLHLAEDSQRQSSSQQSNDNSDPVQSPTPSVSPSRPWTNAVLTASANTGTSPAQSTSQPASSSVAPVTPSTSANPAPDNTPASTTDTAPTTDPSPTDPAPVDAQQQPSLLEGVVGGVVGVVQAIL